jgi:hypothetical protein
MGSRNVWIVLAALSTAAALTVAWPPAAARSAPAAARTATGAGAAPAPKADPRDFGLDIPANGPIRQGEGRRVLVKNADGKQVVAQVHVEIGDRRLIVMPDGRLASYPTAETQATKQPFQAATMDEISKELVEKQFAGFRTKTTKRYLYVYNTSKEFYIATSRILETMYPAVLAYFKRQKFPVHDPAVPLVVIMFATEAEFMKYHAMPPGVVAYYSGVSNHVVMYESGRLNKLAPDLADQQSAATIAHEGVHQVLHNIGVQERLAHWPIWISEGLAEYFAPTTTDARSRWKGVGKVNDMRMFELARYLKGRDGTMGDMVEHTVSAARLTSTGYASAWALTHYLAARKKDKFFAYLTDVSKAQPLAEGISADVSAEPLDNKELFVKHFGANFAPLETDLIKYLQGLQ